METVLQKKASPVRQLSVGPRLCSGLHLACKEQREISPGDRWGDSLANPTAAACPPRPVDPGRRPCAGVDQGTRAPKSGYSGIHRCGPPQARFSARDTVCPLSGCTWKGAAVGRQEPPPAPVQVPVQLCKKCRAWKSLGEIAGYLECKHFPGKGG